VTEFDCQGLVFGQRREFESSLVLKSFCGYWALSVKVKWPECQVDHSTAY
jgi:hypothetical protein